MKGSVYYQLIKFILNLNAIGIRGSAKSAEGTADCWFCHMFFFVFGNQPVDPCATHNRPEYIYIVYRAAFVSNIPTHTV